MAKLAAGLRHRDWDGPALAGSSSSVADSRPADHAFTCRPAVFGDSRQIARFTCTAGEGLYEFLFDNLIPFVGAADFLTLAVATPRYPVSFSNWFVAIGDADGSIIGAANVFPADLLKHDDHAVLPLERRTHIRPLLELQDWGSMFLNALAVSERHRRCGVGARLLAWAEDKARQAGLDRLSLHAWADNKTAVDFYTKRDFVPLGVAEIPHHPRLPHVGGSILMRRNVSFR